MALIASILATTACQKDNADDTWRLIPVDQITVESGKAVITVNEIPNTDGTVQLVADNKDDATLNLTGIVPGYAEVHIGVDLQKRTEDTFAFKGSSVLSTPPSIAATLRSTDDNPCYAVSVEGTITIDGVINVAVTTEVQGSYAVSLTGTWDLVRQCKVDLTLTPVNGPVQITWKAAGAAGTAVSAILPTLNMIACQLVAETLDQVTFDGSGNIMAKYYDDLELGDDPMATIKALLGEIKPDISGNVTFNAHHSDWTSSPKANLAFWYAYDKSLFVVPNVSAIIEAENSADSKGDMQGIDVSSILEILNLLKEYGVDVNALNAELQKILGRGIELKYSLEGGNIKVYVDKDLCDPVVTALIPALSALDSLLEQLSQSTDPEDQKLVAEIKLIMGILGLEKPSDLGVLWKATTEFEIALNLTNQMN